MATLLAFLVLFSFAGFFVGLAEPRWVKMSSRKQSMLAFGISTLVLLILFSIIVPSSTSESSTNAGDKITNKVATTATSTDQSKAVSSTTTSSLTPAETLQANDAFYISTLDNSVSPDISQGGLALQYAGSNLENLDFSDALGNFESFRGDVQQAQSDLQSDYQLYQPLTPDVERINTLMSEAFSTGLTGANTAITDLENANNDGVENVAMPEITTMDNNLMEAKELIAGWQAKNPQ